MHPGSKLTLESQIAAIFVASLVAVALFNICIRKVEIRPGSETWHSQSAIGANFTGQVMAKDVSTEDEFILDFHLQDNGDYCHAEMWFIPNDGPFNLEWTESVKLVIRTEGIDKRSIRFHVRHIDEKYYDETVATSMKYNQVTMPITTTTQTYTIPRHCFYVPNWWAEQSKLPIGELNTDMSQVGRIEILTGSHVNEGQGKIVVESIVFSGHWLPSAVFYRSILGIWMVLGGCVIFGRLIETRKRLNAIAAEARQLSEINQGLSAQTRKLSSDALKDSLTGLWNRRGLRPFIDDLEDLQTDHKPHNSIIIFDIDNFKQVNDSRGHLYGDEVLIAIGKLAAQFTSNRVTISRWGGEEFVVLCGGFCKRSAVELANRLRESIASAGAVTCSFGVHEQTPGESFLDALDKADRALYAAKRQGKNLVTAFSVNLVEQRFPNESPTTGGLPVDLQVETPPHNSNV